MSPDRPDGSGAQDPDHGLDIDAVFADIVANFGRAPTGHDSAGSAGSAGSVDPPAPGDRGAGPEHRPEHRPDHGPGATPGIGGQAGPVGRPADRAGTAGEPGPEVPRGPHEPEGRSGADEVPGGDGGPPAGGRDLAASGRRGGIFEPGWNDPLDTPASWDDEGHFVPPTPGPVPPPEPRRKAAWAALIGSPLLIVVLFVLGIDSGSRLTALLSLSFIAGFVYLVATMRTEDRPGDDGAVV